MRGTKRSAIDSTPIFNSDDSLMQRKKVLTGSLLLPGQGAEPLIQSTPLNLQRAETSRQHVKALNAQFASWVQAQLQNHPEELWEDGVQDYLNHAKSIMEKFSDVVSWLKSNASKTENFREPKSNDVVVKSSTESEKNTNTSFLDKPGFGFPLATTASTGSSWSPGIFSNSKTPFTFGGSQVSFPGNTNSVISSQNASNDEDGEDDIEQPSSPSLKKSEEKGIIIVYEVKCKLYVKPTDPADKDAWKDKGMGNLIIKCQDGISKGTKESKPNIVIRNDVGKVLLNALLYPGIKTNQLKNAIVAIFHTSADGDNGSDVVARTFCIKTKNDDDRDKLAAAIQEYAPAAA